MPPWHAAYPTPKTQAEAISREDVLDMLRDPKNVAGKDFILVDLRRNDHEVSATCYVVASKRKSSIPIKAFYRVERSADPSIFRPRACGPP